MDCYFLFPGQPIVVCKAGVFRKTGTARSAGGLLLAGGPVPRRGAASERTGQDHVIMLDSVSKRYSMCGVRIGTLISKNSEVVRTALKFAQARLSPPSLGQLAGEAALETPPEYFREVTAEYIERRNFMVKALNAMPGVVCPTPRGAFYTVVHLPVDDTDRFAQWILSDFEYKNQTVMMAPASGFYSTPGLGKQEVRIAYVLKKEDLARAMETLAEALKVYPGRIG